MKIKETPLYLFPMTKSELLHQIKSKESYLCVGLDSDITKIPSHLKKEKDPIFEFNKQIIDATVDHCVAYKPNIAFYEAMGPSGWESLAKTIEYIPKELFTIADAKRGDIGNTGKLYAKAFFETMNFDSITVSPYMGSDSILPFLEYKDKWIIVLAHTSNPGSQDFQLLKNENGKHLYETIIEKTISWTSDENCMFVVGATRADKIAHIRSLAKEYFFLVPGVGAQGGDLKEVSEKGLNSSCGLIVNSSRGIIYASSEKDFGTAAKNAALSVRNEMSQYLQNM